MNKKIVITGGASGIGELLTRKYLQSNHHVIIIDMNNNSLQKLKKEFKEKISTIKADLRIESDIDRILKEIQPLNQIDILVNNAGYVSGKSFVELSREEIKKTFEINVYAPFFLTQTILKEMIKKDSGSIVNICSASAFVGVPKLSDYSGSKAALLNMNESIRYELKKIKSNVHSLAVCPFYIDTGMFKGTKTRFPFLLPILPLNYVTHKIYDAIEKKKQRLIMPIFVYSVFLIKVLPVAFYDKILRFFGILDSMDDFIGRKTTNH